MPATSKLPPVHSTNRILSFRKSPTPRTVNAGLPITHYLNEDKKDTHYRLTLPNGSFRNLIARKRKDRHILEFTETRIPGTYELSDQEKVVAKFVVLPSISESILEKVSEQKISSAATTLANDVVRIDGSEGKDGSHT